MRVFYAIASCDLVEQFSPGQDDTQQQQNPLPRQDVVLRVLAEVQYSLHGL